MCEYPIGVVIIVKERDNHNTETGIGNIITTQYNKLDRTGVPEIEIGIEEYAGKVEVVTAEYVWEGKGITGEPVGEERWGDLYVKQEGDEDRE